MASNSFATASGNLTKPMAQSHEGVLGHEARQVRSVAPNDILPRNLNYGADAILHDCKLDKIRRLVRQVLQCCHGGHARLILVPA